MTQLNRHLCAAIARRFDATDQRHAHPASPVNHQLRRTNRRADRIDAADQQRTIAPTFAISLHDVRSISRSGVVAVATGQHVPFAVKEILQHIITAAADKHAWADIADDPITAATADQRLNGAVDEITFTGRARGRLSIGDEHKRIGASGVVGGINAITTKKRVPTGVADKAIITRPAIKRRARRRSDQHVSSRPADNRLRRVEQQIRGRADATNRSRSNIDCDSGRLYRIVKGVRAVTASQPVSVDRTDQSVITTAAVDSITTSSTIEQVHTVTAIEAISTVAAHQIVVARPTDQLVAFVAALEPVASFAAVETVDARTTNEHITSRAPIAGVITAAEIKHVGSVPAVSLISPRTSKEHVVTVTTAQPVIAVAAIDLVVTGTTGQLVVTTTPEQTIISRTRVDAIVAIAAVKEVLSVPTHELVGTRRTTKPVAASTAVEAIIAISAVELVRALATTQHVMATASTQHVIAAAPVSNYGERPPHAQSIVPVAEVEIQPLNDSVRAHHRTKIERTSDWRRDVDAEIHLDVTRIAGTRDDVENFASGGLKPQHTPVKRHRSSTSGTGKTKQRRSRNGSEQQTTIE